MIINKPNVCKLVSALGLFGNNYDIILCVGSPKLGYDSLAPMIGSMIDSQTSCSVLGTRDNPVDRTNVVAVAKSIKGLRVLAIDSAEGGLFSKLGSIKVCNSSFEPGEAVNPSGVKVGTVSIKVVTTKRGLFGVKHISSDKLKELSILISKSISEVVK